MLDEFFFNNLMNRLLGKKPDKIAVAVSGGCDSLCLTYFLHKWCNTHSVMLYPFIVDHQLREESNDEALQTKKWLEEWGLTPNILQWIHPLIATGIQEKAREARYKLLALACHRLGIKYLCLGHHQDDQLETVLMRHNCNSHWRGLAGISAISYCYGIAILRPLLPFPKEMLTKYLVGMKIPFITDSSNNNFSFTRVRMRHTISEWSIKEREQWITKTQSYGQLRQAEAEKLWQNFVTEGPGYIVMPFLPPNTIDQGIILLQAWIGVFRPVSVKKEMLSRLWQRLQEKLNHSVSNGPKIIATCGGCIFVQDNRNLYIFREWGRVDEKLELSKDFVWDSRFFCYGTGNVQRSAIPSGTWQQRYSLASFPHTWPNENILFSSCRPPHPIFFQLI